MLITKDILHQYFYSEVMCNGYLRVIKEIDIENDMVYVQDIFNEYKPSWEKICDIKPLLYKLSDLTFDHWKEISKELMSKPGYELIHVDFSGTWVCAIIDSRTLKETTKSNHELIQQLENYNVNNILSLCNTDYSLMKGFTLNEKYPCDFTTIAHWHRLLISKGYWIYGDQYFNSGLILCKKKALNAL